MESPSIASALVGSFHSRDLYRAVAAKWQGKAFLYLLVLVAIWCGAMTISMYRGLATIREEWPPILRQIPPITIADGTVSTEVEQPYTIVDSETGAPLAIIDTTGTVTSLEGREASILITQKQFIVRTDETTTETHDFAEVEEAAFDGAMLESWLTWLTRWGPIVALPFMLVGVYLYRIVQALLYAAFGLALNSMAGTVLKFPVILRLSMVAVTPSVALAAALEVVGVTLPYGGLICLGLTIIFLRFGIRATLPEHDGALYGPGLGLPPTDGSGVPPGSRDPHDILLP